MKRTLVLLLMAVVSLADVMAQIVSSDNSTTEYFIVNGNLSDHFDGKSLVGETISAYTYDEQYHFHLIYTSSCNITDPAVAAATKAAIAKVKSSSTSSGDAVSVTSSNGSAFVVVDNSNSSVPSSKVCVVDGKVVSEEELKDVNPSSIQSMEILKNESPTFKKYAKDDTNVVVIITTKK